jgi:Na+/proline symporter
MFPLPFHSRSLLIAAMLTPACSSGGAVFPAAFAVTWKKQSKWGAICGAIGGTAAELIAWFGVTKTYYGEVTITTTGGVVSNIGRQHGQCAHGVDPDYSHLLHLTR